MIGLNGSGKTTLVKLLLRFYDPSDGQILWDGIDIREFNPEELRQRISAIFQDFARFDLTVQENIGVGNINEIESVANIERAAMRAGIHDTIAALPRNYQTVLAYQMASSQEGIDFSGGQWQRVALARMFMRKADFLILDEPTTALDVQAEDMVRTLFASEEIANTTLIVSHHLNMIRMADLIAVLQDGKVVEQGSHDELLSRCGIYAELYPIKDNPIE